jgi:hypothetical protein
MIYNKKFKFIEFKLGEDYNIWYYGKKYTCRFIKTTPKGYNLLDLNTSKCILTRHLYTNKFKANSYRVSLYLYKNN